MNYKHLLFQKKQNLAVEALDHFKPGILGWVLGVHSAQTFEPLWAAVIVISNKCETEVRS